MEKKELRLEAIENILKELDRLLLTRQSFNYTFNNENGEILKFEYKDNPKFHFVTIQPTKNNNWKTIECPGLYFTSPEEFELRDFSSCRSRIFNWVQRVIQEISVNNNNKLSVIQQLRENLEKNINDLDDPNEPFSNEEAGDWINRVDETLEQLETMREKLKIQESEMKKLKKELNKLKENIHTLPKKTWVRSIGNRILDMLANTGKEITKAVAEGAVKGLISGPN